MLDCLLFYRDGDVYDSHDSFLVGSRRVSLWVCVLIMEFDGPGGANIVASAKKAECFSGCLILQSGFPYLI